MDRYVARYEQMGNLRDSLTFGLGRGAALRVNQSHLPAGPGLCVLQNNSGFGFEQNGISSFYSK